MNNSQPQEEAASPQEPAAPNVEQKSSYRTNSGTTDEIKKYLKLQDFYQMLGVSQTATEDEIKRAYQQLAMKFHPDKCREPGAQEVFKKIATAYDCLTNKEKRDTYDRYGNEEPQQHYQQYRQRYHDDIDPNDIFSFFFGGSNPFFEQMPRNGSRTFYYSNVGGHQGRGQRQSGEEGGHRQQAPNRAFQFMQLLPILLILFSTPLINLFKQDPLYAMNYSWSYSIKRQTSLVGVSYFVQSDFQDQILRDQGILYQVDREIQEEHIRELRNTCYYQQQVKYQYQHQYQMARSDRDRQAYQARADRVDMRSCNTLEHYNQEYDIDRKYP